MNETTAVTLEERDKRDKRKFWVLFAIFNVLGIGGMTVIQGLLGQGVISSNMDGGSAAASSIGWWGVSLLGSICPMLVADVFFLIIGFVVLAYRKGSRRSQSNATTDQPS